ncbi:MAG: DUF4142 domain-containing protein [Agriterribacter sp.]
MKYTFLFTAGLLFLASCGNQPDDPVKYADSANEVKNDMQPVESDTQKETSEFLVKAADGGFSEVAAARVGEEKATDPAVKELASKIVADHTAVNNELVAIAGKLNITVPQAPSQEHQEKVAELSGKNAKEFDKSFVDAMVEDHKKTISLFKDASEDEDINVDVKTFINATLPKLDSHLAAAEALQKKIK